MIKLIAIVLILFVFGACQNKSKQNNKSPIVFDLTRLSYNGELKLSYLNAKNIEYIPLETNDLSLFGNISKLIVSDTDIYIKDFQQTILRFGSDGSFKNRINRQGRGPKEYNDAYDFIVDPDSQDIYICSVSDKKIYSYSNQGKFLNCFPIPQGTLTIAFAYNNILCHRPYSMGNKESNLVLVSKNGHVIEQYPSYKYKTGLNSRFGYINEIIWFEFNDNLYIKDIHSDTVFLLNNNKQFIPQYVLNHGGKTITTEARNQFDSEEKFLTLGAKYSVEINVWRFGDYIISEFMYNDRLFIYAGGVNINKEHFGNLKHGIINDIDGGPNMNYNTIYYYNDNTMLSWVNASDLIIHVKSGKFKKSNPKYPERKKALEKLASSLDENDNPVLMLVKLKE